MANERNALEVLAALRARRREIEASIEEALTQVDRDIETTERFIEIQREVLGTPPPSESTIRAQELRGMTQLEALVTIAAHNDGVLVVKDARRLLIEAGLARGHVAQAIHARLARDPRFEHVGSGRYRLVRPDAHTQNGQAQLPVVQEEHGTSNGNAND